jgi:DNA primase catalytic core
MVTPAKGLWNCFGCKAGGNVLTYLELKEGLSFLEAVDWLRQHGYWDGHSNGNGHSQSNGTAAVEASAQPSRPEATPVDVPGDLLARVAEHYHQCFLHHQAPQNYLTGRGLKEPDVWRAFQVGFANGSLLKKLPEAGALKDALTQLGVLNAQGKEHFLGCVVVPLTHPDHGVVGLYGRRIADGSVTHLYLPGPQRGVFNWNALQTSRTVVVAESVLDAMALCQVGFKNTTCLFGVKNLPPDLDALLGRFATETVVFCLDGDAAGREATGRLATQLQARGIHCRTARLPDGQDPNSFLVSQGATSLRQALLDSVAALDTEPAAHPNVEPTGDGFRLHLDGLVYRVTPRPPFKGHLKVTLKATRGDDTLCDTQDLYQARARTAIASQLQHTFKLSKPDADRHLLVILEKTETWALALEKPADQQPFKVVPMTPEQTAQGMTWLQSPNLVGRLLDDMETLGYVGEEKGKLLAYLISISRLLDKPLAGIVLSQSGAGKSSLSDLVEMLCPPEHVVLFSRLSALALAYMPKDFLKRKFLILEERAGSEAADYSIRVLLSRHKFSQAVVVKDPSSGMMQTQTFEVEGPIAYLETTTNPAINDENASRCFELGVDESEAQTARIHAAQRARRSLEGLARSQDAEAVKVLHHILQRLFKPVKVLIPYVELLSFPTHWLRTRRDNERFLSLIEAIAFLHQYQRQHGVRPHPTGDIHYVEATVEDYRLAYDLAKGVLSTTLHELSRAAQELWVEARAMVVALKGTRKGVKTEDVQFTRRALRDHCGWPDRRLRDALQELVAMEYIGALAGSQGKTYQYRLLSDADSTPSPLGQLTTPEELEALLRRRGQLP